MAKPSIRPGIRELLDTTAVPGDEPWGELADRVERVLALHVSSGGSLNYCKECTRPYPCPTVRALEGEE